MGTVTSAPDLTLPEEEAGVLRAAFADARVILEYGSGGSTVMAAKMPGKRIFSVESDKGWVQMMRSWFADNPPAKGTDLDVIWSDIGETKAWGYPVDNKKYLKYSEYPLKIWDLETFEQPDVVFVDGRFRTGCVMAAAMRTLRPIKVFLDDYVGRDKYRVIETFFGEPKLHGRMAEFDVKPTPPKPERMLDIIDMMIRP